MTAHSVAQELLDVVKDLPQERQEQLLELTRAWAPPPIAEDRPPDPVALLHASGRLDQDYLNLARSELRSPPELATVRAALARIPGSLSADCIAERDER